MKKSTIIILIVAVAVIVAAAISLGVYFSKKKVRETDATEKPENEEAKKEIQNITSQMQSFDPDTLQSILHGDEESQQPEISEQPGRTIGNEFGYTEISHQPGNTIGNNFGSSIDDQSSKTIDQVEKRHL